MFAKKMAGGSSSRCYYLPPTTSRYINGASAVGVTNCACYYSNTFYPISPPHPLLNKVVLYWVVVRHQISMLTHKCAGVATASPMNYHTWLVYSYDNNVTICIITAVGKGTNDNTFRSREITTSILKRY